MRTLLSAPDQEMAQLLQGGNAAPPHHSPGGPERALRTVRPKGEILEGGGNAVSKKEAPTQRGPCPVQGLRAELGLSLQRWWWWLWGVYW